MRRSITIALVVSAAFGATLIGSISRAQVSPSAAQVSPSPRSTIGAKEADYKISLGAPSTLSGPVTFAISNSGPSDHEFVIIKTKRAQGALPIDPATGTVPEDARGLTVIDEEEDVPAGGTANLRTFLGHGSYVIICNLPDHYRAGMHAAFTVR